MEDSGTPADEAGRVRVRPPLSGGLFVLEASGAWTARSAPALRDAMAQVPVHWPLLLDLTGSGELDGSTAGALLAAGHRRLAAGTAVAVAAGPALLARLRTSGLSQVLLLHGDVEAAAAALRGTGAPPARRPVVVPLRR